MPGLDACNAKALSVTLSAILFSFVVSYIYPDLICDSIEYSGLLDNSNLLCSAKYPGLYLCFSISMISFALLSSRKGISLSEILEKKS